MSQGAVVAIALGDFRWYRLLTVWPMTLVHQVPRRIPTSRLEYPVSSFKVILINPTNKPQVVAITLKLADCICSFSETHMKVNETHNHATEYKLFRSNYSKKKKTIRATIFKKLFRVKYSGSFNPDRPPEPRSFWAFMIINFSKGPSHRNYVGAISRSNAPAACQELP